MTALASRDPEAVSPRPPPDELDELTLARAQRGDARARRDLVIRYQRPVFALLSRMLHGRAAAPLVEDLAQETFLRVFRALQGFDRRGPARLSTWILTIASRLAIDELRRRRPEVAPIDPLAEPAGPAAADADAERVRLATALQHAIDDLSPEFRAAFLLREYHELEYAEIADNLQVDLGTVKSRLSRARAALRRALEEVYRAR
ncbi:RNA polymerase sigma factor [Nannocystis pusilla]|uniref:RNA polymerase sigma factor n=1 Tax=Nannocystis pusilla TaxID=889268 RepID=UPI003B813512